MSEDFRESFYEHYVSEFNETNAEWDEASKRSFYRWATARYLPHLSHLPKSSRILELGCGHGRMLAYLKDQGFANCIGIDSSEEQITIAKRLGLNAEVGDIFSVLETTVHSFDAIIAIDVVEHFTKEELLRMFGLMNAALVPGGTVLLQTVNGAGLFPQQIIYGDITHTTIFSPGSMTQLLRRTGFAHASYSETAPLPQGLVGIARSSLWCAIRFALNAVRRIEAGKSQAVWTENFICSARKA